MNQRETTGDMRIEKGRGLAVEPAGPTPKGSIHNFPNPYYLLKYFSFDPKKKKKNYQLHLLYQPNTSAGATDYICITKEHYKSPFSPLPQQ
jgi:hypothetical protein